MSDLSQAIDALADAVPHGHLLAATNGADLLHEAARLLGKREADLAVARAERDGLARILTECADELEGELDARYMPDGEPVHKGLLGRWERDMTTVNEARAALAALPTPPKEEGNR